MQTIPEVYSCPKFLSKNFFFEKLTNYTWIGAALCADSGKVWMSFKLGCEGSAYFTNMAVRKITMTTKKLFFSRIISGYGRIFLLIRLFSIFPLMPNWLDTVSVKILKSLIRWLFVAWRITWGSGYYIHWWPTTWLLIEKDENNTSSWLHVFLFDSSNQNNSIFHTWI
jgi:hypothetical protein